jgi:hypothetical protein
MPAEAVQTAAAEGVAAAESVATDPAAAAQAEAGIVPAAEKQDEVAVAEASDDEAKPWYSKPSGMVLIGIAAIIGYKALASKE